MPKAQSLFKNSLSSIIEKSDLGIESSSVGTVLSLGDGTAQVSGLDDIQAGELVDLGEGELGLALNLKKEAVGVVMLGAAAHLEAPPSNVRAKSSLLVSQMIFSVALLMHSADLLMVVQP
jgi:F0F1-type ATP synthase alpha subunit